MPKPADMPSRMRIARADKRPIKYDITVLESLHPTHKKGKARSMYLQEDDAECDKQGVRPPEAYALVMVTGGHDENDK